MLEDEEDRKAYEALEAPKSIVVRYGYQKLVAELPYNGDAKPGCGSKLVVRTGRGTELAEMLTTTCPNAGCSKSVSRNEMLKYIENSGGKDFPFTDQGKILRVAEVADLNEQARLDSRKPEIVKLARTFVAELDLSMKPIEAELLLGGERIIIYYLAEQWVDFRELVKKLASELQTRIEMHQVNDREEARLVADYERCGQYCCCKNFLKVLKPVSMRSAKVQKATLDPQKISGRCGRLMCCLRYEDKTYEELRKKLPHRKTLVETEDGVGLVWGSQILTQLVLVKIGSSAPAAYPLEEIRTLSKEEAAEWRKQEKERAEQAEAKAYSRRSAGSRRQAGSAKPEPAQVNESTDTSNGEGSSEGQGRRRRRRGKGDQPRQDQGAEATADTPTQEAAEVTNSGSGSDQDGQTNEGEGKSKRRRRRRRRRKRGKPSDSQNNSGDASSNSGSSSNGPGSPDGGGGD